MKIQRTLIFLSVTSSSIRIKKMVKATQVSRISHQIRVIRVSRPAVHRIERKESVDSRIPSVGINMKNNRSIQLIISIF